MGPAEILCSVLATNFVIDLRQRITDGKTNSYLEASWGYGDMRKIERLDIGENQTKGHQRHMREVLAERCLALIRGR